MIRHALIKDDTVINVIVWDKTTPWTPPAGFTLVECPDNKCDIGDKYDAATNVFSKPVKLQG